MATEKMQEHRTQQRREDLQIKIRLDLKNYVISIFGVTTSVATIFLAVLMVHIITGISEANRTATTIVQWGTWIIFAFVAGITIFLATGIIRQLTNEYSRSLEPLLTEPSKPMKTPCIYLTLLLLTYVIFFVILPWLLFAGTVVPGLVSIGIWVAWYETVVLSISRTERYAVQP